MGIEFMSGPTQEVSAGIFSLPTEFDREKHAAQWSKVGADANKAIERQHLIGTKLTADGWSIYKDQEKKVVKRQAANGEYVLMFRPKEIQNAVNAIYGNVGLERMAQEKVGQTTGGVPITDPGLLNEATILKATGEQITDPERITFNKVPHVPNGRVEQSMELET